MIERYLREQKAQGRDVIHILKNKADVRKHYSSLDYLSVEKKKSILNFWKDMIINITTNQQMKAFKKSVNNVSFSHKELFDFLTFEDGLKPIYLHQVILELLNEGFIISEDRYLKTQENNAGLISSFANLFISYFSTTMSEEDVKSGFFYCVESLNTTIDSFKEYISENTIVYSDCYVTQPELYSIISQSCVGKIKSITPPHEKKFLKHYFINNKVIQELQSTKGTVYKLPADSNFDGSETYKEVPKSVEDIIVNTVYSVGDLEESNKASKEKIDNLKTKMRNFLKIENKRKAIACLRVINRLKSLVEKNSVLIKKNQALLDKVNNYNDDVLNYEIFKNMNEDIVNAEEKFKENFVDDRMKEIDEKIKEFNESMDKNKEDEALEKELENMLKETEKEEIGIGDMERILDVLEESVEISR
eukprot:GAHX01001159.1.p1 GENE.GAHX01001159.1~~GAHX01001159.1.p1  ORF type:complete len:419 (+),score=97.86 GAHX01001159.1:58-1314(+)